MQKLLLFSIFLGMSRIGFAQDLADLDAYEKAMKPGTQLTYQVTAKPKSYTLVITLKKVGDEIAFDWKTSEPDNKSGSVTISSGAMGTAEALFSTFKGGDSKLDKETCLWVSKKVVGTLSTGQSVSLKINGASDTLTQMSNTVGTFNFQLNGNPISVEGWEIEGGGDTKYTVDIIESAKFPLICKLDMGWSMYLSDIKLP